MELPFTDFHMDHKFMGQRNGFILKLAEIFNLIGGIFWKAASQKTWTFSPPHTFISQDVFQKRTQKNNLLIPIVPSRRTNIAPENRSSQKARWSPNQHVFRGYDKLQRYEATNKTSQRCHDIFIKASDSTKRTRTFIHPRPQCRQLPTTHGYRVAGIGPRPHQDGPPSRWAWSSDGFSLTAMELVHFVSFFKAWLAAILAAYFLPSFCINHFAAANPFSFLLAVCQAFASLGLCFKKWVLCLDHTDCFQRASRIFQILCCLVLIHFCFLSCNLPFFKVVGNIHIFFPKWQWITVIYHSRKLAFFVGKARFGTIEDDDLPFLPGRVY